MKKFGARVRVPLGGGTTYEWTEIMAETAGAAKRLLEAIYGRGNVIGVPVVVL